MQKTFNYKKLDINKAIAHLNSEGYIILENAMNKKRLTCLRNDLDPYFNSRPNCQANFFGFKTTRIEALLSKSRVAQEMATNSVILRLVDEILGSNCDGFQINLTQGIQIYPGERAQLIHPDSALYPISNKPFEFVVNALWAYSDFTRENGATVIVPGSHRWPENRQPLPEEIQYAEMPAGSVLLYQASLLHGGGANITNTPRTGIAISYCLGWLRQSENQYLSYPIEVVRTFSETLQRMIGYNVHRPNLGWVNGHSPIELIRGTYAVRGAEDFMTDEQNMLLEKHYSGANVALTNHSMA
jgi:ectoine hydroxylase-related dioxygenase (phytanoyl-CoA dioxygenase family)